jgi:hypothetical protein
MALSSTTAHVMDAMATEIAPRIVRIQSIDEETRHDPSLPQSARDEPPVESRPTAAGQEYQERAAEMQNWWAEAIARNMNLPEGYTKVAVLLIKWAEELDELNTSVEVC